MAVLAADVHIPHLGNPTKVPVRVAGADTFYAGACVFAVVATGYAVCLPAASTPFLGICTRHFTTTAAGDYIEIWVNGVFKFPVLTAAIAIGSMGDMVICDATAAGTLTDNVKDYVVDKVATLAATDILIGQIVGLNADGTTYVQLKTNTGVANALGFGG